MDGQGAAGLVGIEQRRPAGTDGEGLLPIGRGNPCVAGFDPDLQQPAGLDAFIDLAVHHTGAGAHPLHLAGPQHLSVPHRVAVVELALHHHRHDLHVAVGVHAEAAAGGDRVVVDHPQRPEAHPGRVVMGSERERMPAVQPVELAVEALGGRAEHQGTGGGGVGAGGHGLLKKAAKLGLAEPGCQEWSRPGWPQGTC